MASRPTKQLNWTDAHFCGLKAQTNVYGLTTLKSKDGLTKLLAASINGHFVSVEYQSQKSFNRLIPITREGLLFSASRHTAPGADAETFEIVSVDSICSATEPTILAITYFMLAPHFEQKSPSPHMNIYFLPPKSEEEPYQNIIDAILNLSEVQNLNLDFIPFKIMHWTINKDDDRKETCFLLGGGDHKVHVFRQTTLGGIYEEEKDVEKVFPEFAKGQGSCITQMELMQVSKSERLTAVGMQTGKVSLFLVDIMKNEVLREWSTELDSPITSLKLFTLSTQVHSPDFLDSHEPPQEDKTKASECIHLLVTSALDPALVFWDVVESGMSKTHPLPYSNSQDVVLCSCVTDIDFDGENEILIGTYGQVLLAYKFIQEEPPTAVATSTPFQSNRFDTPFQSPTPIGFTPNPTPPGDMDKPSRGDSSLDHEKNDQRRRHKSVAALLDSSGGLGRLDHHDRHKSDELSALLDASLKDSQMARLVRSQENLAIASPSSRSVYFATPDHMVSSELSLSNGNFPQLSTEYPCYRLTSTKRFSDPVMGLACEDVMGDGMLDLVVLTLKGMHIMQPDLNEVSQLVLERLNLLVEPPSEGDDDFRQLQTEMLEPGE